MNFALSKFIAEQILIDNYLCALVCVHCMMKAPVFQPLKMISCAKQPTSRPSHLSKKKTKREKNSTSFWKQQKRFQTGTFV